MGRKPSSPSSRPRRIVIGHTTWDVVHDDVRCNALASDGVTQPNARQIVVRKGMHADRAREVLLHEVLHAVIDTTPLDLEDDEEEALVTTMTGPILDVIRRNPQLIAFLQQ